MANRHLARSIVLQTLYEWDFSSQKIKPEDILKRDVSEFAPGAESDQFMKNLLSGVIEKQKDLDNVIASAAPEWPIEKIAILDRNILRIGLFELLFANREQVPPKVAINEAIELAKKFGGETSGKFINGVLGAVYKEMGEPGKDDKAAEKKPITNETLVGAVVYAHHQKEIYIALVHDVFGHWTLTKGKLESGENEQGALVRGAKEELGITIKVKDRLGENAYETFHPEKGKLKKHVVYFLAEAPFEDLTLENKEKKGGLDDVKWFRLAEILDLNFYDDILPIVTKAINLLVKS
ncbi:MAG: transcription antitermination factor NusB [Candidatus Zambryskibacteria bacterium RIFCSPLOWO2_01_FULL_39_39]|uniref:Transcription antitermination protein NusB n=1 Tax=Candidatus Zambryskibacteria bacterium RIFCSPLOWO2_01_FULL_39_39 TaxID=1802758 RepID=A0A1G2TZV6_9BACT|nr:MAG: transcription antitermination factor NusB [Candidatus Zambryskibacteria bacterium RIFCSPHIGHO2_01_FULL_39_63]OHA94848.1 MAG: transcription antitermination factor NusB [Candidatus Zambryskibacteria bacterium RIFCSPHIGHO2_02_FULL_39_19]OHA98338.1 MAG: transcription antitermination factor NusB [Candidatus Zambryskibacteria bacterium RIFCSPHIGHO2_12_FULL_39_21]OHB02723.1 MAG: transcription antitermination factor NusB [Candidatus Zambryskibacteria bacterium RIFCSPLOWO2_01_FULL_39_39]